MRSLGIVREIDPHGRLALPKEMREKLRIALRDPLEVFVDGEEIILKKYEPGCIYCHGQKDTMIHKEKVICKGCAQSIAKKLSLYED